MSAVLPLGGSGSRPKAHVSKKPKKTARVNSGTATNDLVVSAYTASNDVVFPQILEIYVPKGAAIADLTYGKGVFWKKVKKSDYRISFSDLKTSGLPATVRGGVDARRLPYEDASLDAIVFDPPYMHTPGGTAHNGHQNFEEYYANNAEQDPRVVEEIWRETGGKPPKYHEAVLDLYFRAAREALRVLKPQGIYIVKCQDEVCTNRQRLTHVEITNEFQRMGLAVEDLFVVVRSTRPGVSRVKNGQVHARKNHSYFMVYRKPKAKRQRPARVTPESKTATRKRTRRTA